MRRAGISEREYIQGEQVDGELVVRCLYRSQDWSQWRAA
jgi:hypothetical protein